MRVLLPAGLLAAIAVAGLTAAPQDPPRTVWSGVYTEAQAVRGQEEYKKACGHCHRDNLTGGGSEAGAPALTGPVFIYRWRDLPLSDMFIEIGTTMPKNKPDSLTPAVVADIMSFLLKASQAPTGKEELAPDIEKLKLIVMTERR